MKGRKKKNIRVGEDREGQETMERKGKQQEGEGRTMGLGILWLRLLFEAVLGRFIHSGHLSLNNPVNNKPQHHCSAHCMLSWVCSLLTR